MVEMREVDGWVVWGKWATRWSLTHQTLQGIKKWKKWRNVQINLLISKVDNTGRPGPGKWGNEIELGLGVLPDTKVIFQATEITLGRRVDTDVTAYLNRTNKIRTGKEERQMTKMWLGRGVPGFCEIFHRCLCPLLWETLIILTTINRHDIVTSPTNTCIHRYEVVVVGDEEIRSLSDCLGDQRLQITFNV